MNKEMFIINTDVKEERINNNVEKLLNEISNNCQKGISITRIECEEFFEVRKRIETKLKELGVKCIRLDLGGFVSRSTGPNGRRYGKIKVVNV
jgi:PP-loop superfamily ATP-utilizing enzyme